MAQKPKPAPRVKSLSDLMDFLKQNEQLISEIGKAGKATKKTITDLFARMEENRTTAESLVGSINEIQFAVSGSPDVRDRQKTLLMRIEEASKDIQRFKDDPAMVAIYLNLRAGLYIALAATYNQLAAKVVEFRDDEVAELRVLLRRAALDTAARQRASDVLDAAVQISKLVLKVAIKVVAL